jgi:dipeptide/tripeptide permease
VTVTPLAIEIGPLDIAEVPVYTVVFCVIVCVLTSIGELMASPVADPDPIIVVGI